ncbi:hypothetical protein B0H10DRAFT_1958968 [Mycena sp. CBHHK59/15]|nr:hypothetical protein B0H10DRAFT_1958968 [Mycena sp. CBHHK59/15]
MSGLKTVIQLHNICVTSLTNPHDDLPGDMKMFAQLIIEDNIFLQTVLVASEDHQKSWKFSFGCKIPPNARTFLVTVLRHSETEGIRLLGHAKIGQEEIFGSPESASSFELILKKVNLDGPSLKLNVGFSVSEVLLPHEIPGSLDMPEDRMTSHMIPTELRKMQENSSKTPFSMDSLQLWVMHERILLCNQSNDNRAQLLNILGDILLYSWQGSGTVDGLNQAVWAYKDAVRDDLSEKSKSFDQP